MAGSSPFFCELQAPSQFGVGLTERTKEVRPAIQRYDIYLSTLLHKEVHSRGRFLRKFSASLTAAFGLCAKPSPTMKIYALRFQHGATGCLLLTLNPYPRSRLVSFLEYEPQGFATHSPRLIISDRDCARWGAGTQTTGWVSYISYHSFFLSSRYRAKH